MYNLYAMYDDFQINYQLTCKNDLKCSIRAVASYVMSAICLVKVCTFQLNTDTVRFMIDYDSILQYI